MLRANEVVLKTDEKGRVRTPVTRRESLLAAMATACVFGNGNWSALPTRRAWKLWSVTFRRGSANGTDLKDMNTYAMAARINLSQKSIAKHHVFDAVNESFRTG